MAFIRIDIDDREWLKAQRGVERLLSNPSTMLTDMGEHLQLSTDQRFDRKMTPDGQPWPSVSPEYAKRKAAGQATRRSGALRDPAAILQLTRDMRRLTRYQVEGTELQFGSDRPYARAQNEGNPRQNLPARRWLGLSAEDEVELEAIARDHLQAAIDGF